MEREQRKLFPLLIPASNEPSSCEADIHDNRKFIFYCMANAARVNNPVACSGVVDDRERGDRYDHRKFMWIQP